MDRLELEDIKKTSFEVLLQIKDVCEKNNISYSLTGGTLLGAVRHKGFIPWDDDVDIMLPRPDYEKLMEIGKKEELPFILLSEEICGEKYPYPFAKGCHKDTILYEKATVKSEVELGVYVDIFPVDGMGNSEKTAKRHSRYFQFVYGLKVVSNWKNFQRSRRREWYFEFFRFICYLIGKLLSKDFINKLLNKSINKYSYSESNYAGRLVGDRGTKEVTKKEVFENLQLMKFETREFSVISDYDTYLTNLYGDYMQLPPKEKQVTHHEFEAFWRK